MASLPVTLPLVTDFYQPHADLQLFYSGYAGWFVGENTNKGMDNRIFQVVKIRE
jgi:hypothetical protein